MTGYLVNPVKRKAKAMARRKKKRKTPRRNRGGRFVKKATRKPATRKRARRKRRVRKTTAVATTRRRRSPAKAKAPVRRRRRRAVRRNPVFGAMHLVGGIGAAIGGGYLARMLDSKVLTRWQSAPTWLRMGTIGRASLVTAALAGVGVAVMMLGRKSKSSKGFAVAGLGMAAGGAAYAFTDYMRMRDARVPDLSGGYGAAHRQRYGAIVDRGPGQYGAIVNRGDGAYGAIVDRGPGQYGNGGQYREGYAAAGRMDDFNAVGAGI